jgi:4-hydroxy-3-methylbut-2-enyl diphosphate reductase
MKITLSRYAGFCDGVERAYEIVKKIAGNKKVKKPVFVLSALIHNEDVVRRVEEMGIRKIEPTFGTKEFAKIKMGTIIITAHGVGPEVYEFFRKKKVDIVDTTCPRVIKVQRLARLFRKRKYQIVIIGEKQHKEVQGIYAWADKKAFFVENEKDLQKLKLNPKEKIAVISQTTQDESFIKKAFKVIKKKYPQAEAVDTLCLSTHNRQSEVKKLAKKNDIVIVIGSKKSANSRQLFKIGKKENPQTHFIENARGIKNGWFKDVATIGITAGASTPDWIITEVIRHLGKYEKNNLK